MKIIDWKASPIAIRLYLAKDDLAYWWGDDWDDAPWQCNAGPVYDRFVSAHIDIILPEETEVWEPGGITSPSEYISKEDIIKRQLPIIVGFCGLHDTYEDALRDKNTLKLYMGRPLG